MQDLKWSSGGLLRTASASSQPGPSASAPVASLAPDVAAREEHYGAYSLPQPRPLHQAQQQPQQRVQEQSLVPQVHPTLPISWEDTRQAISQANAQSSDAALHHGKHSGSYQAFTKGALPSAAFGAMPSREAPNGAAPNGAAPSPALRAGGCTGVNVSGQAKAHEPEARQGQGQGQGHGQVKVQDYAPSSEEGPHAAARRAAQHVQQSYHAQQAQHAQQAATWAVEQLPEGQYVCVMQDGAKLTLEQLYYTLEHVGKSLPEDKYEALSMMIKQLTEHGEKYEPQSMLPTGSPQ